MQPKRLIAIALVTIVILLIPLLAMQFSNEVNWTLSDFAVASVLIFGSGFLCNFVLLKVTAIKYRIAICFMFFVLLLLIWAELAVGLFETPFSGS